MAPIAVQNSPRVPSLDGLRGFSILLVVIGHLGGTRGTHPSLEGLHQLGNWGVKFFFVISGYIITRLLLTEFERSKRIALNAFWIRRAARILPAYFAYVAFMAAAASVGLIALEPNDLSASLSFTMNYQEIRSWYLNHCWSLSVEEQFYLVWPFAVMLLGRTRLIAICLAIVCAAPVIRLGMWSLLGSTPTAMTRYLPAIADTLAAGALLAAIEKRTPGRMLAMMTAPRATWIWLVIAFAVPATLFHIEPGFYYVAGQSAAVIAITFCIAGSIRSPQKGFGRAVNHPVLIWHGLISYSLYLWQEPFLNTFDVGVATTFPLNLALAYGSAILSYTLVEKRARLALGRLAQKASPARVAV
jgi:peptidoglycan/LPS O-acetylase OafA/YrhL